MRIPIRVQLALLVLTSTLVALAIISIATWVNNYNFVVGIISQGLSLTVSLKAAQLTSSLELLQSACGTITTRLLIQEAVRQFYNGNNTDANWVVPASDVQAALDSSGYITLLQAILYPREDVGNIHGLLNVTRPGVGAVILPYNDHNGNAVVLGDEGAGYPPMLYPNLTYVRQGGGGNSETSTNITQVYAYPELILNTTSSLFLGPLQVNTTFAIVSLTLPIIDNTNSQDLLGFFTIVASASALTSVLASREGIGESGTLLLLGPARASNRFSPRDHPLASASSPEVNTTTLQTARVDFVFDPESLPGQVDRHNVYNKNNGSTFALGDYPAALNALSTPNPQINNASSQLSTTNEQGSSVAVGVARPQTTLVDWVLILEVDDDEAFAPTGKLRNILLACVFGTAGIIALLMVPMAHFSVLPIQRLKEATKVSMPTPEGDEELETSTRLVDTLNNDGNTTFSSQREKPKQVKSFLAGMRSLWYTGRWQPSSRPASDTAPGSFKLPGKVEEKKHFITDELTELTSTFNEVSDELMINYTKLEEKVQARTQELEMSKKAAEAANESKTLFIASISHELKTPLNGILGMCAVCMGEDDLSRVKNSLQVIYKSGDLLLHLLNDLLTFSKNEIGQQLSLEEGEFTLSDIRSQIVSLFDKQVRESHINFGVKFIGTDSVQSASEMTSGSTAKQMLTAFGPPGTGRLKDMRLWGDIHRILQVIINLVSNSLKFTPEGGKVEVRITCTGDASRSSNNSKTESRSSKDGSQRGSTPWRGNSLASHSSTNSRGKAKSTTASKQKGISSGLYAPGRALTPPPTTARTLIFEFEVEDNGPGIPPHLQQSVFEPFVQGDINLTKKYGGTGLGLSICSQLSTLLGGTITVKSTVDVGTTFNMRIPLKLVDGKASRQSSSPGVSGTSHPSVVSGDGPHKNVISNSTDPKPRLIGLSQPFFASAVPLKPGIGTSAQHESHDLAKGNKSTAAKLNVLVAEDNLVNQEVVLRMLKLENIHDVMLANDGQEAYNIVEASMDKGIAYDLIFMDIQMPNLDGLQSTRLIRQLGYLGPIVALTAFAEESNIKDCIDAGMDMFLSKPIRRPALKQALERFVRLPEG